MPKTARSTVCTANCHAGNVIETKRVDVATTETYDGSAIDNAEFKTTMFYDSLEGGGRL